jgi:hypothetical protein
MREHIRPKMVRSRVTANWLKFGITLCALVILLLGVSEPTLAQTCSPVAIGESLTAGSPSTTCAGNFNNTNINFGGPTTPLPPLLTLTLQPGVVVNSSGGAGAVNLANVTSPISPAAPGVSGMILANDVNITLNNPAGTHQSALRTQVSGSSTIGTAANPVSGIIDVTGGASTNAIFSQVFASVAGETSSVNYDGPTTPGVTAINATGGMNSSVIQACANAGCGFGMAYADAGVTPPDGNAIINATGNLTGVFGGISGFGLDAVAGGNGTATVTYNGGTINLTGGGFSSGIFASGGAAIITTLSGTTVILNLTSTGSAGIEAFAGSGATLANVASTIEVTGPATPPVSDLRFQPTGIRLQSNAGGSAEVNYTGPGITVRGGGGQGISAISRTGSVTVNASGPINVTADSSDAIGILADSGTLRNAISGGNPPALITGAVNVTASNVSTPGQFGAAISANGAAVASQ